MKTLKAIFHVLTVASTSIAALPTVGGKVGVYVALASSFISLALHAITAVAPDAAKP